MKTLSKIIKGVAHPFVGLLPAQEKLSEKIDWYSKELGVLSNSAIEFASALAYGAAVNPATNNSAGGTVLSILFGVDALWRIYQATYIPSFDEERKFLGILPLQISYEITKFTYDLFKKEGPIKN